MKKISLIYFLLLLMVSIGFSNSFACINLDINIGTIDSTEGRLFAEIVSTFIHERTGTKSIIKFYPDRAEMHSAIVDNKIELVIVDIVEALRAKGMQVNQDSDANYKAAKTIYKKDMHLVLLKPFGVISAAGENDNLTAPLLANVVLEKFPALPRLLKKLAGKIDADTTNRLLALVKDKGEKSGRVAKDFLVSKRLI